MSSVAANAQATWLRLPTRSYAERTRRGPGSQPHHSESEPQAAPAVCFQRLSRSFRLYLASPSATTQKGHPGFL